jgi:hypothetical protein
VNLHPEPLWARESRAKTAIIAAAFILLTALFGIFQCWPIVVPTAIFGIAVFVARLSRDAGGWRGWLWTVTLPAWIMTWFVTIAAILTLIGTFFRGPGWSWVWPWEDAPRG